MAASLGGLDALVFTGGIGENQPETRARLAGRLRFLGVELDEDANHRGELRISPAGARVATFVIPTDEEIVIARHTLRLSKTSARKAERSSSRLPPESEAPVKTPLENRQGSFRSRPAPERPAVARGAPADPRLLARRELPLGRPDLPPRQPAAQGAAHARARQAAPPRPLGDDAGPEFHLRAPEPRHQGARPRHDLRHRAGARRAGARRERLSRGDVQRGLPADRPRRGRA